MNQRLDSVRTRVIVVGGGLAGLSAAEAIAGNYGDRFEVTLLEAKKTVGGRAGSFTDPATGESVDYCQHVAMGCCTNLIGLLRRRGLSDQMQRYQELLFLHPDYPPSRFAPSKHLPAPFHLRAAFSGLRFLSRHQHRQVRRAMLRLFRTPRQRLVDRTASDWLQSVGQDAATIRDFWDVILVSALGERPEVVSMAAARKVFVDGFAGAVSASDVLVPRCPLAELFGRHLRESIEMLGANVLTQRQVKGFTTTPSINVTTQNGEQFDAEHVIVAVPWHSVQNIVTADVVPEVDVFSRFPSSPISGLHLWFDRQITERHHAVMVGTVSQWMFRQPWESSQRDQEHYYQVVISASQQARQVAKEDLVQTVVAELRDAFPAAQHAKLLRSRVVTDPHSVFSIRPEIEASRPPARTGVPGLHLAGDWIATGWPATMEGAVISGRMAASSVLTQEGLDAIQIEDGLPRGRLARWLIR